MAHEDAADARRQRAKERRERITIVRVGHDQVDPDEAPIRGEAGIELADVAEGDFADYGGVLQIGVAPIRIDIINRIAAVSFDEAVALETRSSSMGVGSLSLA